MCYTMDVHCFYRVAIALNNSVSTPQQLKHQDLSLAVVIHVPMANIVATNRAAFVHQWVDHALNNFVQLTNQQQLMHQLTVVPPHVL